MPYRAMALVAASLLFATQCYAENVNTSKSNTFKQTKQPGGKSNSYRKLAMTFGHNAPRATTVRGTKSNSSFRMNGGGGGKGASGKAVKLNTSRSN
jgi:hypothetical protein